MPAAPEVMYDTATTPMVVYNNKSRPIGVEGGGDVIQRNEALLKAQEGYKAPRSMKEMAKQAFFGFLQGGIPGAIMNTAHYGLDQNYRNQVTMGGDIANTQGIIKRESALQNQRNELLNDESQRGLRDAQTAGVIERTNRPPKTDSKFIERVDGVYEVSAEHPDGRKVGGIPAEARNKNANPTRYFETPDGVWGVNDEHPDGFKVPNIPGTPKEEKPDYAAGAQAAIQEAKAAERDHLEKRRAADETVSALEAQLAQLGAVSPDDPRRMQIESQLSKAKHESNYRQTEADNAATKLREARADAAKYARKPITRPSKHGKRYVAPKVSAARVAELMQ
jgi:hypothetical protein